MAELKGKVAIVTGGAGGIGKATVELFVQEGAAVLIADVQDDRGQALADRLGESAHYVHTDVSDPESVQAVVQVACERFGQLDIMFNNAGIAGNSHARALDDDFSDFERVMKVDLLGVMLGSRYAGEVMAKQGSGSIINTASIGGSVGGFGILTYRAAKAGVIAVTQSLAIDFGEYNVRVNSLSPGATQTEMVAMDMNEGVSAELAQQMQAVSMKTMQEAQPLARTGTALDVAQAALFLASDRSAQISGLDLRIDGAAAAGYPHNTLAKMQREIGELMSTG
ncbi:MAG: glucose 1-dehydrogenase [Pseudomonadota bacterium]